VQEAILITCDVQDKKWRRPYGSEEWPEVDGVVRLTRKDQRREIVEGESDIHGFLEPISKLLRDLISRLCGARNPHLFPHKLRFLRSSKRDLRPLMTF
jgi:hypothetical protein